MWSQPTRTQGLFEKAGGKWDPQKILDAILVYYEQAHELDGSRAMASREHRRRPNGVHLVGYDPNTGEGTDLVPDLVEKYDPDEDLDTTGNTFDTAKPVYFSHSDNASCGHEEDDESHQVMWTNTNYDEEEDTPQASEESDEDEESSEDSDDEDQDEDDEDEDPEDDELAEKGLRVLP